MTFSQSAGLRFSSEADSLFKGLFKGCMGRCRCRFIRPSSLLLAGVLALAGLPAANAVQLLPGTVVGWGQNIYMEATVPADAISISAIAAGQDYSLALKSDGRVMGWGRPDAQPLAALPAGLNGISAIAAGSHHAVALKNDGTLTVWGDAAYSQPLFASTLKDVAAIAAAGNHSLALHRDGSVTAWGANSMRQTDVPSDLAGVTAIAAGRTFSMALKSDGTVRLWGGAQSDGLDVPAGLDNVTAIAAGARHALALTADGKVRAWGDDFFGQAAVPVGLDGVQAIAGGEIHSVALRRDGSTLAWGGGPGFGGLPALLGGANALVAGARHNLAANLVPMAAAYKFGGFRAPVSGPPAVNAGKAGRTYPVKWQLKNADDSLVSRLDAVRSIAYRPIQCGTIAAIPVELNATAATSDAVVRYDADAGQFIYHWKTPSAGCYTLTLTLDSGQEFLAYFNLGS